MVQMLVQQSVNLLVSMYQKEILLSLIGVSLGANVGDFVGLSTGTSNFLDQMRYQDIPTTTDDTISTH